MPVDAGSIYSDVRIKLDKLTADIKAVNSSFDTLVNTNKKQADAVGNQWTKSSKTVQDGFKQMDLAGVAAFAAIGLAAKKSVELFAGFEQSMANTRSATRSSAEDFARLEAAALKAGETTRFTARQSADAMYYLGSAGWSATQIMEGLNGVLQLAGATQADLAFTAETVTAAISQYSLAASDAERVSNVFAAGIAASQATIEKLSTSLSYVGPVASGMNMSLEETVGVLSILYNNGLEASTAGTALRSVLADLANAASPANKKLAEVGITFDKVNPQTNGFAQIIQNLNPIMNDTGKIMEIFGDRAGPAMIKLLSSGRAEIEKYTQAVTGTQAAAEAYATQNDTLAGSLDFLKSAAESAAIQITKELAPGIRAVVDFLTLLLQGIANLPGPLKIFIGITAAGIPIVLGLSAAFTALAGIVGTIIGPVALVVAGIAGLTAIVVGASQAMDDYNNRFDIAIKKNNDIASEVENLGNQYLQLQAKTKKTAKDYEEMEKVKNRLIEIDPTFKKYIDEETGAFKLQTEELTKNVIELRKRTLELQKQKEDQLLTKKLFAEAEIEKAKFGEAELEGLKAQGLSMKEIQKLEEENTKAAKESLQSINSELRVTRANIKETQKDIDALKSGKPKEPPTTGAKPDTGTGFVGPDKDAIKATEKIIDLAEQYRNKLEDLNATALDAIEIERKRATDSIELSGASGDDQKAATIAVNKYYDALRDKTAMEEMEENTKTMRDRVLSFLSEMGGGLIGLFAAIADARIAELDRQMEAELAAAGVAEESEITRLTNELKAAQEAGDEKLADEKARELESAKIKEKYEKQKAKIVYDAAMTEWGLKLATAIAGAAGAVINGLNTPPFLPVGIAMGALAAILGGVQVATVAASMPKPPAFEMGGIVPGSNFRGDKMQIAANSGEMILTREQQSGLFDFIKGLQAGGSGIGDSSTTNININDEPIIKIVHKATRDGRLIIDKRSVS